MDIYRSEVSPVLDHFVDEISHLLLVSNAFCNFVYCLWINIAGKVQQKVEISIFEPALLYVSVLLHVLTQIFLSWLHSSYHWKLRLLDNRKFIAIRSSMSYFHQQKLRLKFSNALSAYNERRIGIISSECL